MSQMRHDLRTCPFLLKPRVRLEERRVLAARLQGGTDCSERSRTSGSESKEALPDRLVFGRIPSPQT